MSGYLVLLTMCLGIFVPNYAQYQLSPFAGEIMSEFGITHSQFSSLFTAPMIPGFMLSLVAGILVDRYNSKYVIGSAIFLSTVGGFISLFTNSYGALFFAFFLTGITATFLNSCNAKLLGLWFPPERVSGKIGIFLAFSNIGMTIALATTAYFPNRKAASLLTALLFLVCLIVWWVAYKEPVKKEAKEPAEKLTAVLKIVAGNRNIWLIGFSLFFVLGANITMSSFLPTLLTERGISSVSAGYFASIYTFGCLLSCFLSPILAQKMQLGKKLYLIYAILGGLGVALAWRSPEGFLLGTALLLTGFFVGGNLPLMMALPIQLEGIGPKYAGIAGGLTATLQLLGAVVLPSFVLLPLASGSLPVAFLLGGVCMLLYGICSQFLPH